MVKASEERLLSPEQSKHCIELIDERNMYDYVLELDALSKVKKARILNLTLLGVYSNLQMYFITGVSELISQAQMEDLIVLFYKFQRNMDDTFNTRAKSFIQANLDNEKDALFTIQHTEAESKDN